MLVLMAAYIWCLGIALIYPPGALTIESRPYMSTNDMEVLVMNRAPPTEFDPETYVREEPFQTLAYVTWGGGTRYLHFDNRHVKSLQIQGIRLTM
jgi:hypothetical protein